MQDRIVRSEMELGIYFLILLGEVRLASFQMRYIRLTPYLPCARRAWYRRLSAIELTAMQFLDFSLALGLGAHPLRMDQLK